MVNLTTAGQREAQSRSPVIGFVLVVAITAGLVLWGWQAGSSDSYVVGGWFPYLALFGAAAVLLLGRFWAGPPGWLGAAGFIVVIIGSGIGRGREEGFTGDGQGDVVGELDSWVAVMAVGVALTFAATLWALVRRGNHPPTASLPPLSFLTAGIGWVAVTALAQEVVTGQWISGRPIRQRGRTAPPREHRSAQIGELWLDAAVEESEAITAFEDLADRLARVDAPVDLVARSRSAAADERRHVRRCERVAATLDHGQASRITDHREIRRPRRVVSRRAEVTRLAVESFVDGVVGEGFAARRLEAGAKTCAPEHGKALAVMAIEERDHARLGEDIVRWARAEYPTLVGAALARAGNRMPDSTEPPKAYLPFEDEQLRAAGLVDGARANSLWATARDDALRWLAATRYDERQPTG